MKVVVRSAWQSRTGYLHIQFATPMHVGGGYTPMGCHVYRIIAKEFKVFACGSKNAYHIMVACNSSPNLRTTEQVQALFDRYENIGLEIKVTAVEQFDNATQPHHATFGSLYVTANFPLVTEADIIRQFLQQAGITNALVYGPHRADDEEVKENEHCVVGGLGVTLSFDASLPTSVKRAQLHNVWTILQNIKW